MTKIIRKSFLAIVVCAISVAFFYPRGSKAGDHVGYKKVFLRAHCKKNPDYVCRLSDPPDIKLPFSIL